MNIQNNDPLSGFRFLFWLAVGIWREYLSGKAGKEWAK